MNLQGWAEEYFLSFLQNKHHWAHISKSLHLSNEQCMFVPFIKRKHAQMLTAMFWYKVAFSLQAEFAIIVFLSSGT